MESHISPALKKENQHVNNIFNEEHVATFDDSDAPSLHSQGSLDDNQVSLMTIDENHNIIDIFGGKLYCMKFKYNNSE